MQVCGDPALNIALVCVLVVLAVVVLLVLMRSALSAHKKKKVSASSAVLKILINFLQTISFLGDFKTRYRADAARRAHTLPFLDDGRTTAQMAQCDEGPLWNE